MKTLKSVLLIAAVLFTSALQAQTADEIINKHIEAIGGKDKIGQVKSLYIEYSMEAMGNTSVSTESLLAGKGFKSESEFNGMKLINCFTDKGGWSVNPFTGNSDPQAMPDEVYKAGKDQLNFGGALVNYASKGYKAELLGKEGNNFKIKLTGGSAETTYYIDGTTWYLTKTTAKAEMMGQSIEIVISFSDYKKTDFGIVLPYSRATDFGGFALSTKITKVEVNKDLDAKIFEMPK